MKAKLDDRGDTLSARQVLFESTPGPRSDQIGGRIALTPDGYIFLTLGDRWGRANRHKTSPTISAPSSASAPTARSLMTIRFAGASARGRRSGATAIAIRKASPSIATRGELWSDEHGPQGGDELNLVLART